MAKHVNQRKAANKILENGEMRQSIIYLRRKIKQLQAENEALRASILIATSSAAKCKDIEELRICLLGLRKRVLKGGGL